MIALKNRTDIIIKPANKGSSVVVMDRDQYIAEDERQLKDNTYYQLLEYDPTTEFAIQVAETLNKIESNNVLPPNTLLVSMDVISIYTNICMMTVSQHAGMFGIID